MPWLARMKQLANPHHDLFDVLVVGGGPAGLTAAIWLGRYLRRVVVIDSGDPRNWETYGVNGFLGLPGIRPAELRARGRQECRELGVQLVDAVADNGHRIDDDHFVVSTEDGREFHGKRLLLAIGIRDIWPQIPGLDHIYGASAHVCPDCDGFQARGRKVVVVGSGRKAVGLALNLTTWTNDLIICTNGEPPDLDRSEYCDKLDALNIPVLTERISRIDHHGSTIYSIEFEDGMCLDADKLFFAIGQQPADAFCTGLCSLFPFERDEEGSIVTDRHGHTSVLNVFAAGDITPGPQLAIKAAAEGAVAALSIHKSLVPESRKLTKLTT